MSFEDRTGGRRKGFWSLFWREAWKKEKSFYTSDDRSSFSFSPFPPSWCPLKRLTCNWRKRIKMNGELHVVSQTCTLKGLSTFFFATHPPGNLPEPLPPHLPSDEFEFAKLFFHKQAQKVKNWPGKISFFSLYTIPMCRIWLVETHTFTARVIPIQLLYSHMGLHGGEGSGKIQHPQFDLHPIGHFVPPASHQLLLPLMLKCTVGNCFPIYW